MTRDLTTVQFLANLRSLDIQVFVEGDRLRCSAPEGTVTPELQAELAQRKPELISLLRHTAHANGHAHSHAHGHASAIVRLPRERSLPLSFAQQRLWFLDQLVPENPFYNMPAAVQLQGHLNLKVLQQAFNAIVQRHETLRTTFTQVDGQPAQTIASSLSLHLPVIDLQSIPTLDRDVTLQRLATEEAHRPFKLTTGPLLRVTLLKLAETEHILLLTLHHIISDGWSMGVLMQELGVLYTAFLNGQSSPLSELSIQYADFAHWQRRSLQGEILESQLAYWGQQLKDLPGLNLPTDRPHPPVQGHRGATQPLALSPTLTAALEALGQAEGVTLFMTLFTAFQILLYRYTGQTDLAVGVPIANRNRSEIEGLIGFFVNSLVLRTNLAGNPTFRELLRQVREVALAAYAHQDVPFEKLVEELHPDRDLSRNPLFQVVFALQNAPMHSLELPNLTLKPWQLAIGTTRFDLEFHLWEQSQGLSGLWQEPVEGISGFVAYNTDLFDAATIARLLTHFQTLLEAVVAHPDRHITELSILSTTERHQLLSEWNETQLEYASDTCIHHLFESQAAQTPNAIAVVGADEQLTYQALDQRSNQLAHYLQQLGVRPDSLVGICVDRSVDTVVAVLGVLKAGGAYLPLDPEYPRDRLSFMLTDAKVSILITQQSLVSVLLTVDATVICLETEERIAQQSQEAPTANVTSENLAYVIYTSGSTGTPKGVLIQHRGLCNVVTAQIQAFHLPLGSRILQFSSFSFDAWVFELLLAFGVGGTLYIAPPEARSPGAELSQFLREHAIAATLLPPAVLAVLPAADLPALQTVIAGGEACTVEIIDRWAIDRRFFNAYGPTEATIWASVAQLQSGELPSIGRPVANTQIYLLDAQRQPVPIGVAGELYIGGDGLARGYLNRPDLTAERFIPNPFQGNGRSHFTPSPRLYKTGDLARYRADGSLEFLGRVDDQVKLRGFRIELGEIETVLNQHAIVQQAVVTAHPQESGKQLVAYVVLNLKDKALVLEQVLHREQIEQWQKLYNQTYAQTTDTAQDPTFNIIGWQSSYTGQPIAPEQMREWLHDRVQQVRDRQPQKILEIGCGTGLMLFQLAPHCAEYWATDFSSASLDYIRQQLPIQALPQVKLLHRWADDFTHLEPAYFDAVILNSVVQYFPSLDYLVRVLEGAVQRVKPGGFIFIGDVRNLRLLTAFQSAVQLYQADAALERSQLQQRVQRALFEEAELVIEPDFFHALRDRLPAIRQVKVELSRGRFANEMTQFRYNVMLQIGHSPEEKLWHANEFPSSQFPSSLHWTADLTPAAIHQQLAETQPEQLQINGVLNARVVKAVQTADGLADETSPKTAGQLRQALEHVESGFDPEDWWDLETELPYTIEIRWSDLGIDRYDVVCLKRSSLEPNPIAVPSLKQLSRDRPWHTYANQPLQTQLARQLIPQLRQHLEHKLPAYMVPSAFVVLETLPLTANGKVDRRALPAPDASRINRTGADAEPRSPLEVTLARLWSELLGVHRVGIHDNFFALGGHSLLATQLTSRIRDESSVELPLQSLFEAPTIAQLAPIIDRLKQQTAQPSTPAIVPLARSAHRRSRSSLMNGKPGEQP
ncbi:MAG: amino acid adenylation domain-containing protein [Oscillatoriophycideae cyanobacterium NC_groundwater_1537_Pr4_S-0.65um_50_18]|nr:amino acid adenylation domain-containing protein [Oscillatoriophycideae cyanobacterium NC_groundwater_1537_Pr4_S-0.65um_50_18]